jgi:hypothetical protein
MLRSFLALAVCSAAACAFAQDIPNPQADWKEMDAPPPPALRTEGLIPIEVAGSSLRFGIDPKSITVGGDRVVRYVVVATSSSGVVNGIYEGLRCDAGTAKVYARYNPDSGWVPASNSDWQDVRGGASATRHSYSIARSGACANSAPNGSAAQIAQDLRSPVERRYWGGGVNR